MYEFRMEKEWSLRTNAALRDYVRNEYGTGSLGWILADARRSAPKVRRPTLAVRLRFRRAPQTHRVVGHKGTPRLAASDLQPSA